MPRLPVFIETLDKLKKLHEAKNEDYATADAPLFNFEFTSFILEAARKHRVPSRYLPYLAHIATKLARIINLLGNDKPQAFEPVTDSLDDMACYVILMKCERDKELSEDVQRCRTFAEDIGNK